MATHISFQNYSSCLCVVSYFTNHGMRMDLLHLKTFGGTKFSDKEGRLLYCDDDKSVQKEALPNECVMIWLKSVFTVLLSDT